MHGDVEFLFPFCRGYFLLFYVKVKTFQTQDKKYFLGLLKNSLYGSSAYSNSFWFQGRLRSTVLNILPVAGSHWNLCHHVNRNCRQLHNRLFIHVYYYKLNAKSRKYQGVFKVKSQVKT